MKTKKPVITEELLFALIAQNNAELKQAVEDQEAAHEQNVSTAIEDAIRNVGTESGESIAYLRLLQYLRGDITKEQLLG